MEQVTGIEPASPAWKAGALAIVLHLHAPSAKIVSSVIIASVSRFVNAFSEFFCTFLRYLSRARQKPCTVSCFPAARTRRTSRSGCHCTAKTGRVLWPTASTVPSSARAKNFKSRAQPYPAGLMVRTVDDKSRAVQRRAGGPPAVQTGVQAVNVRRFGCGLRYAGAACRRNRR